MKLLRLKTVLAAVDDDDRAPAMLQGARELATAAAARLHVLHVIPSAGGASASREPRAAESRVQGFLEHARIPSGEATVHLLDGVPAHVIRSLADRIGADVIVLGRHRESASDDQALGSTALQVVTNSWAPCLILADTLRLPLERVLVPVDLSDTSRGALALGLSWASALRGAERSSGSTATESARLTALLIESGAGSGDSVQSGALEEALNHLRKDAGTWSGVGIEGVVMRGQDVPAAVAQYATRHQPDLIVLGTRGLGADTVGRLGSVSFGVSRRVTLPIVLVPPAVWSN